ncbi:hypothetical protein CLI92_09295 [Vandammella animalimorsus]|uniref:Bacteriophage T5 Orf172 DNA-binding domain-containing protein n=1 Tax=Vandammella animalimorsus TaxID=2029117 RepID=A0A2A2T4T2_9BURK|nr:GIY-YIG nuclease family protein [Vandammella animalimorsus]PAT31839.1 hypothetical protein CK626_07510 [Vandammella animalimorsus]PAX16514.1 hypothetical protein CLI92_09295 [Vandammella animalimorsus]PAX18929.1 hypothetical protein CLI93_11375 [Vandammella animalimorsus]
MIEDNGYEDVVRFSRKPRSKSSFVQNFYGVPGHIYIARNDAHRDGIYKIGLTTRMNPQVRIDEINRQAREARVTGHIGQLRLIESFETIDCGRAESTIHAQLASCRYAHNREFFQCSLDEATAVIRSVIDNLEQVLRETGKTPQQLEYENRRMLQEQEQRRREEAERRSMAEREVHRLYTQMLEDRFPEPRIWPYWIAGTVLMGIVMPMFGKESIPGILLAGMFAGLVLHAYFSHRRTQSAKYKAIEAARDQELELIKSGRSRFLSHPQL